MDALSEYVDFRYRVIGTRLCDYFLADGTGKTVTEAWPGTDEMAQSIIRLYRRTCRLERPLRHVAPAGIVGDAYFPAFDSIYLPYATDSIVPDRVIGAFVFNHNAMDQKRATLTSRAAALV